MQAIRGEDESRPSRRRTSTGPRSRRRRGGRSCPSSSRTSPSVTQYSETGSGQGYAYFTLRGLSQTRVNMTFDGVPLNEPEDSAVYTADFANLTRQPRERPGPARRRDVDVRRRVLRGLGELREPRPDARAGRSTSARRRARSARRGRARTGTRGTFGGGWRLSLRPSWQTTDGFREHSGVKQDSLFFTAARDFETSSAPDLGLRRARSASSRRSTPWSPTILEKDLTFNPMSPDERDHFHEYLVDGAVDERARRRREPLPPGLRRGRGRLVPPLRGRRRARTCRSTASRGSSAAASRRTRANFGTFHLTPARTRTATQSTHTQDDVDGDAQLPRTTGTRARSAAS